MNKKRKILIPILLSCLVITMDKSHSQTKADSGWVPLFNGKNFEGFYGHFLNVGPVEMDKQNAFVIDNDSGIIHVPKAKASGLSATQGQMFTRKEYSWYKVRVDYRYANDPSQSQNCGLIIHVDNNQSLIQKIKNNRPRSIEVNMRRADGSPWTLWAATGLGPYITTTVKPGTTGFQLKSDGGAAYTVDPWGDRVLLSSYPNSELPMGQWNHGEAHVYGDSLGIFILNGKLRTQGWDFKLRAPDGSSDPAKRIPCTGGGLGLQSEGHEVWYKNFEIMELEPHTKIPLHAKTAVVVKSQRQFMRSHIEVHRRYQGHSLIGKKLTAP